jgi:hypothetical protein
MFTAAAIAACAAISAHGATERMPIAQQNALVHKYCAVCHTDAARNGGLSLEHYDAAKPDPTVGAMLLSKLRNGAMGAAGLGIPDKMTADAWVEATTAQAEGAREWKVNRSEAQGTQITASIVREVAPRKPASDAPVYRLILSCDASSRHGEMQLAWSPEPQTNRTFSVISDSRAPIPQRLEGTETMGNGTAATSGRAAIILNAPLPQTTLTIKDLFAGETVVFPVKDLDPQTRQALAPCFPPETATKGSSRND